jgi:hypothetical protein
VRAHVPISVDVGGDVPACAGGVEEGHRADCSGLVGYSGSRQVQFACRVDERLWVQVYVGLRKVRRKWEMQALLYTFSPALVWQARRHYNWHRKAAIRWGPE